jgi:hypothetical protein
MLLLLFSLLFSLATSIEKHKDVYVTTSHIEWEGENGSIESSLIKDMRPLPAGVQLWLVSVFVNNGNSSYRISNVNGKAKRQVLSQSPDSFRSTILNNTEPLTYLPIHFDVDPGAEVTIDYPWRTPLLAFHEFPLEATILVQVFFTSNGTAASLTLLDNKLVTFRTDAAAAATTTDSNFLTLLYAFLTSLVALSPALYSLSWGDTNAVCARARKEMKKKKM